jgi:hypothetical protein
VQELLSPPPCRELRPVQSPSQQAPWAHIPHSRRVNLPVTSMH